MKGGWFIVEESNGIGRAIMLQGTASDVGKSVVTTALCRIFKQDGLKVAPFKSQNMALNSYVTLDGKEIGRAQGVQAEACGIAATTDMNPMLIKPTHDMHSQIVVHGKPYQHMSAMDYRRQFLPEARVMVTESVNRLKSEYDVVVMEGAGSPAEINLKHNDIVNMNMAAWAEAPVILVADIDRGGVFASIVGTLELLEPDERDRVKGFIINKFRGDVALLQPGLDWLEERTGKPVLGVLPYVRNLNIEAEDSVVLEQMNKHISNSESDSYELDIAVIRYPRISNFTDMDPLMAEPDVRIRYVEQASDLGTPDAIILPGTKSTIEDLHFLRETGIQQAIEVQVHRSAKLVGICGGYQMLGNLISDPDGAETEPGTVVKGLSYLPIETCFYAEKKIERVSGEVSRNLTDKEHLEGLKIAGYEIHMGRSTVNVSEKAMGPMFMLQGAGEAFGDGFASIDGKAWGTYVHGIFHNDHFRRAWLNQLREEKGLLPLNSCFSFVNRQEEAFDRLADTVREHLRMELLYDIAGITPHD
ncbi:cobyric acid synthase [Paenibacillus marinisediminis]